jgi:hypothetical protein
MKARFACVAVLAIIGLCDTRVMAQPRRGPSRAVQRAARAADWLGSLDDGLAEARRTGKPLMVVIRCVP